MCACRRSLWYYGVFCKKKSEEDGVEGEENLNSDEKEDSGDSGAENTSDGSVVKNAKVNSGNEKSGNEKSEDED